MDALGQTVRDFMRAYREKQIKSACTLAQGLRKEGMSRDQVEEMLYGADVDPEIVDEVLEQSFPEGPK